MFNTRSYVPLHNNFTFIQSAEFFPSSCLKTQINQFPRVGNSKRKITLVNCVIPHSKQICSNSLERRFDRKDPFQQNLLKSYSNVGLLGGRGGAKLRLQSKAVWKDEIWKSRQRHQEIKWSYEGEESNLFLGNSESSNRRDEIPG